MHRLLTHGANPDRLNERGETALHCAVLGGGENAEQHSNHLRLLRLLMSAEWEMNVNWTTFSGRTALMEAAARGLFATVQELLRCPPHARRLGGRSLDLDTQDSQGCTAMHLAASNNFADVVELLSKAGASSTLRNGDGSTAAEVLALAEAEEMLDSTMLDVE